MKSLIMGTVLLAVTLAGCSGGTDSECGSQDDEGRYVVCMTAGNRYDPPQLEVPVGATVVWKLQGGAHNVDFEDGDTFDTTVSADEGVHTTRTFDAAGTYDYHCDPHESVGMTGTIVVS